MQIFIMGEHIALMAMKQQAPANALRDSLATEFLSRFDCIFRQELQGLRDMQNPVFRLEGILVSGGHSISTVSERRVSFGSIDLDAWRQSALQRAALGNILDASLDSRS